MALLRGVNVGGHKTFRPAALAQELTHLGAVNIGAAGTFVIRKRVARAKLRAELARRLPFGTETAIVDGREILELIEKNPFERAPARADVVRFVSVLCRTPKQHPPMPMTLPPAGAWQLKILTRDGPFLLGMYRRNMKAIGDLGKLDRLFGAPVTTRNWNTINAIAAVLNRGQE
ncbi:MAG TPA: DUF1697 domain-containing protein [Vicinamibacterales bacterium]